MNAIVKTEAPKSVLVDMANRYGMEPAAFEATVRTTCMKPDKNGRVPNREEFAAFMLVAKEYGLNPLTKEIYAYAAKGGGIVPIVSVDGWVNLVNSHKACDGFEFAMEHDDDNKLVSCTCKMYRKDRAHPVTVTEYLSECIRDTEPWKMRHRMLRHKAMIQAARYAFGFSGVYDEDEGRTIAESGQAVDAPPRDSGPPRRATPEIIEGEIIPEKEPEAVEHQPDLKTDPESEKEPEREAPHKIVGGTYATWTDSYIEKILACTETSHVFEWITANQPQLDKLAAGSEENFKRQRKAVEDRLKKLREPPKDEPKPKRKYTRKEKPAGDMGGADGPPADFDGQLTWIDGVLAAVTDPDQLEAVYAEKVEKLVDGMMPPDREEVAAMYQKHERRLGGD